MKDKRREECEWTKERMKWRRNDSQKKSLMNGKEIKNERMKWRTERSNGLLNEWNKNEKDGREWMNTMKEEWQKIKWMNEKDRINELNNVWEKDRMN